MFALLVRCLVRVAARLPRCCEQIPAAVRLSATRPQRDTLRAVLGLRSRGIGSRHRRWTWRQKCLPRQGAPIGDLMPQEFPAKREMQAQATGN